MCVPSSSEVSITTPDNSDLPAATSNLSSEGSSSEVDSASASSAIQDHSYSLVNELMPLESADGDLRVTEHSYSLASIGAVEAPPTQQVPSTLRRSSRRSARLLTTARRRSRAVSNDSSSTEPASVANPTREYSRVEERPVTGGDIQDVVEAESSLETETGGTDPVRPTEPPALIAMADGAEHLTESFLNSSLDFIHSRSRDREARQGRERSSSQRRSARVANTRRMHTTRRQSPPNLPLPTLPHVLPLPRTATGPHQLLYAHVPLNLQLLRPPQVNSLQRTLPTLVPSPPNLEPLSVQPASSVLSRTSSEGTAVASRSNETALGQGSNHDEIQMWTDDSFEAPIHSRQHHLRRSSRDLPHLHRRARRNAEPSILNDINEADLRTLHSRAPQSVDQDSILRDGSRLERWTRQRTATASANPGGATAPIDVVVVDSDSEEDADQVGLLCVCVLEVIIPTFPSLGSKVIGEGPHRPVSTLACDLSCIVCTLSTSFTVNLD